MGPPFPFVISNIAKAVFATIQLVIAFVNGQKATTWVQTQLARGTIMVALDLILYYSWLSIEFISWQAHALLTRFYIILMMAMVGIIDYRLIHTLSEIATISNTFNISDKDLVLHSRISAFVSIVSITAVLIEIPCVLTTDSAIWMAIGKIIGGVWAITLATKNIIILRRIATTLKDHKEKQRKHLNNIRLAEMKSMVEEKNNEKETVENRRTRKKVQLSIKRLKKVNRESNGDIELEGKISQGITRSSSSRELMIISKTVNSNVSSQATETTQQQLPGRDEKSVSIATPKERVYRISTPKVSLINFSVSLMPHLRNFSCAMLLVAYTFGPLLVIHGVMSIMNGHHNVSYSDVVRKKQEKYEVFNDLMTAAALGGNQCLVFYGSRVTLK